MDIVDIDIDRSSSSNVATQTEFVNSPILWQCLYVVKNMPEFRNLTYRITKTWNDVEMLVVYREGVLGILGPPIDTITLTLDPKGRCLLSIPFKPVQRVSIVSAESGHIEIASLLAMLRMISGRGYQFCPGLPEKFLAGKACGRFVVLHKVPFKRYHSTACLVYYQMQQQKDSKSSLCALCPRCMQAARWIQSLPYFTASGPARALQHPEQMANITKQVYQRDDIEDVSTKSMALVQEANTRSPGYIYSSMPSDRFIAHENINISPFSPVSGRSNILNIHQNNSGLNLKTASLDVNGNSQAGNVSNSKIHNLVNNQTNSVNMKLLERKVFLKHLLQERSKNKFSSLQNLKTEVTDVDTAVDKAAAISTNKIKNLRRKHKNVCHHCKKTFSTAANLMNHFQRHETVSRSWQKQFREQRLKKSHARSLPLMRMFFWRLKSLLFQHGKKPVYLPQASLRLLLKYLDDTIPFQNGAKSIKQNGCTDIKQDFESLPHVHIATVKDETREKIHSLKRNSSGLFVIQTLLEAPAITDANLKNVSSPTISSSSSMGVDKILEGATLPKVIQTPKSQTELADVNIPEKKLRKSSKLKKALSSNRNAKDKDVSSETVISQNSANSANHSLLINLNLLSDVSLQTAVRETSAKMENPLVSSQHMSATLHPEIKIKTTPLYTFPSSINSQVLLKSKSEINTSLYKDGNPPTSLLKDCKGNTPLPVVNMSNITAMSHLPSLLFARPEPGTRSLCLSPSQKQPGQSLTSSLLRTNMAVCEKQPTLSPSLAASPNNDCGAIDLSKPKSSQDTVKIPLTMDKKLDLGTLSCLLHEVNQVVASENPEISPNVKRSTKTDLITKGYNDIQSVLTGSTSSNSGNADRQSSSTGRARSCRGRKGGKNPGQMHTVIESCLTSSDNNSSMPSGEIHCSYKWTGSGGMVKEHTQMVRELVPSDIMASFLSKPRMSSISAQSVSVSSYNTSKIPLPVSQVAISKLEQGIAIIPQKFSVSQAALNLTRSKSVDTVVLDTGVYGCSKNLNVIIPTSVSPAAICSSASPTSTSVRHATLDLSGNSNYLPVYHSAPIDVQGYPTRSDPQKNQFPDLCLLPLCSSSSSLLAAHTSSTGITISSPSLATILTQQTSGKYEYSQSGIVDGISHSSRTSGFPANQIFTPDNFKFTYPKNSCIKSEPVNSQSPEQEIVMSMPVKVENVDPDFDVGGNEPDLTGDHSPTNLIMDMSPDSTTSREDVKTLPHFNIEKSDLISRINSVVCDS